MNIISLFNIMDWWWILLLLLPLAGYICWKNPYEYNTFAQCVTAIGGNEGTIMISNEQAIPDNQIIPANITLRFIQGGTLNIATGKTVTINGHVQAGLYQIFEGDGLVTFGSGAVKEVYPQWWGIDGTDDHVEIQAAITALPSDGGTVLLSEGVYDIGGQIAISSHVTLSGMGPSTELVFADDVDDRMIVNSDRVSGNSNIIVENLYIDGNKDGQGAIGPVDGFGNAGCLDFWKVTNLTVRNCIIVNAWAAGVEAILCNTVIISGNRIDNSADDGVGINDQTYYATVSDNIITNAGVGTSYGNPCGIEVQDGAHEFNLVGNIIEGATADGILVLPHATGLLCYNGTISANTILDCVEGIKIGGVAGQVTHNISVVGNSIDGNGNGNIGILFHQYTKNCTGVGNTITGTQDMGFYVRGVDSVIQGNNIHDNASKGIKLWAESENNIVAQNTLVVNPVAQIVYYGTNNVSFRRHVDLFMDVLAVSATHVRSNEDLSAGIPITFTIDAQPDVPRTLSGHFDAHANITAYTIEITGTDAKGQAIVETITEADGWDWETDNAFATITSIIMTARTGTGVGDTMDIGITDVLGLANRINAMDYAQATCDVYKIKKNNANATVAEAQTNTTYDTYDMAVIGLAGGDDFTIWYRSSLNNVVN